MKIKEVYIISPQWPIFPKTKGYPCYAFNPQHALEPRSPERDEFMLPYYHIDKKNVEKWVSEFKDKLPDQSYIYEGLVMTFCDEILGAPRYGGAIYAVPPLPLESNK